MHSGTARLVKCPGCGGESLYWPQNPYRPFCSERCKNHDLGAWASAAFRLPGDTEPDTTDPDSATLQ